MANETTERQTCGRRMTELGPWDRAEDLDEWRRDRWFTDEAEDQRYRDEWQAKHGTDMPSRMWRGPGPLPRICSFCGGINPEDAIALIEAGWEVGATTKGYKRYLNPPGSGTRHQAMMHNMSEGRGYLAPSVWSPTPPVKLYVQHFTEAQIERFNAALTPEPDR